MHCPMRRWCARRRIFSARRRRAQRIYERAKAAMEAEAPQAFTLIRAVGPQAGAVFSRDGGLPLDQGVPGLFTYDGYHEVFDKRLPEFAARAFDDDGWVMGRGAASSIEGSARDAQGDPRLADIRRRYLEEYAKHWEHFLASVRPVGGSDAAATNLGFDLGVLRQLAALDSPLSRLARAAARETTLSRPLMVPRKRPGDCSTRLPKDERQTEAMGRRLGIRAEERMERQIVDDRFAALRELITGQPDVARYRVARRFYTLLVVADTALSAQSLPPGGAEVGARLLLEAGKLPAPFREVLTALATSGGSKVVQGATAILRGQAQLQFETSHGVDGAAGRRALPAWRGRPLPAGGDRAGCLHRGLHADVRRGRGGRRVLRKALGGPCRYQRASLALQGSGELCEPRGPCGPGGTRGRNGTTGPTLAGELLKLLALGGPNLEAFDRARQIRDLFFREADGRKLGWKLELKVLELEPSITDLGIDIDGQGQRYVHGPVQALSIHWPGPRGGSMAELSANPRVSGPTSTVGASGPWALLRLLDKGRLVSTATPGRTSVEFQFDGRRALLDIGSGSQPHPFNSDLLKGFRCPGRMG
ncbi:intracellular multiplication and macrophage-killing domain-containing protein [Ditylenchus destructor]|nr:intracellular multiplication and macrophage-killing domain-containing protein [Ditylenchus destructor]